MTARTWPFAVHDARGARRRGTVSYTDTPPDTVPAPPPPHDFAIVLLSSADAFPDAPERTAICVPGVPRIRIVTALPVLRLPAHIEDLVLPPQRMASFAAGRIIIAAQPSIEPADVFPPHSDHPRLDRLALALLEIADAESLAPYIALARMELEVRGASDPLDALAARLLPEDPRERPPVRAPAVVRLARALHRLRAGKPPAVSIDQFAEDLRFLRLFEQRAWPPEALGRLLGDVGVPAKRTRATPKARAGTAKIVRLRPRIPRTTPEDR